MYFDMVECGHSSIRKEQNEVGCLSKIRGFTRFRVQKAQSHANCERGLAPGYNSIDERLLCQRWHSTGEDRNTIAKS